MGPRNNATDVEECQKCLALLREAERTLIDTSDREKERLGHELRENFCQHLVGISLLGNVLFEELARAGLEQARFAEEITRLVKEVVSEIRALEKGLSVAHLEQGEGLVEALRDLAELARIQHHVECGLRAPARKLTVPPTVAMYLFRIAQEALESALHRGAKHLEIKIHIGRGTLVLRVGDHGPDIPRGTAVEEWAWKEFPIMYYRSRVIGADLAVKRVKTGGVEVICRVPWEGAQPRGGKNLHGTRPEDLL
jgi:signal transduction histidine kinase